MLSARSNNLSRAIHNLQLVATALGGVDGQLTSLIQSSNTNFAAISSQDANLEAGLSLLPGTLGQTNQTLGKVQKFAAQLGPTLTELQPFARALAPALKASRPLFHDTTPVIQNQLRPFAIAVQPLATDARAGGRAAVQGDAAADQLDRRPQHAVQHARLPAAGSEQGYLFWGSWLAHIADSLTNLQDAQGPIVRGLFMATCPALQLLEVDDPGRQSVARAAARPAERARLEQDQVVVLPGGAGERFETRTHHGRLGRMNSRRRAPPGS